jgi:predicted AAA+ superfamily ATPase
MNFPSYPRWQSETLRYALSQRRVVILEGSRQCGKTTLVKGLSDENTIYRTLDDTTLMNAALSDPHGFVDHGDGLMIIDEIQRAPMLLQAIKKNVDENQGLGRFLLTGSANIQSLPNVMESLAGRITKVRLRPLSMGEIWMDRSWFLQDAFDEEFFVHKLGHSLNGDTYWNKKDYLTQAFRGGFPEPRRYFDNTHRYQSWYKDYINALLDRDLKDITNIRRKDAMEKLIEILAAWSSKFMELQSIGSHLSLTRPTLETYINALETLYVIERVRPWHDTDYDRVGKKDKLFMTDTGLMASILNWHLDAVALDGDKNGKLLETFVFNQLAAHIDVYKEQYKITHYRDSEKREVDFIIERTTDQAILGIEVKAGSLVDKKDFKHLIWFSEHIAKNRKFIGIVFYTGEHVLSFGTHLWAVPISALWGR